MLIVYINVFLWLFSLSFFVIRYQRNAQAFFLNYFFYILFFSLFYISLPICVALISGTSAVFASEQTISVTANIGTYFVFVFLLSYIISVDKSFKLERIARIRMRWIIFLSKIIVTSIALYVCFILMIHLTDILAIYGRRGQQANFSYYLETTYKIKSLFMVSILLISHLFLSQKKDNYLLLLLPFIGYDLIFSGRTYLFGILILFFILKVIQRRLFKLTHVVMALLLVASISAFRNSSQGDFELERFILIFYEFIYTFSSAHLMYESPLSQDFLYSVNYGFFRILPSPVYSLFFGDYVSYSQITGDANPLGWGLAGSLVAEAISFKNLFITMIFPFFIVIYGVFMNYLFRSKTYSGVILFIISLIYLQQILRYSFFELASYPFYIVLFFGFHIILIDLYILKRNKEY